MPDAGRTRLYFDNAATSFPKPPAVIDAMTRYATELGASPGRGAYAEAVESARLVQRCRERINTLIDGEHPDHVVFTLNTTDALNLAIKGLVHHHLRRGRPVHLVTTWMDHNSILRPYHALQLEGIEVTHVKCRPQTGLIDPDDVRRAIRPETRLVATIHGSNVTGTVQPIGAIGAVCRQHDVPLLVDAAQTLGHLPVNVQAMQIDLLAFPGHKGLLGPLGTGGLYLRPGLEKVVDTVREGGTGSVSERDVQPDFMPDRYECGSHNALGIIGLSEGVDWILSKGIDTLWAREQALMRILLDGLLDLPRVRLLGPHTLEHRCGVFSIVAEDFEPAELAALLEDRFGILTRPGIHCAPLAHQTMDTHRRGGATRLSLGPFLSEIDARYAVASIGELCRSDATVSSA